MRAMRKGQARLVGVGQTVCQLQFIARLFQIAIWCNAGISASFVPPPESCNTAAESGCVAENRADDWGRERNAVEI